jgi:hypothetical protein
MTQATTDEQWTAQAKLHAKAGAEFMDRVDPNWTDHVDPELLVMRSVRRCVVGQYRRATEPRPHDYNLGYDREWVKLKLIVLKIPHDDFEVELGFVSPRVGREEGEFGFQYRLLDAAWDEEIRSRREARC